MLSIDFQHHRVKHHLDTGILQHIDEPSGIFGPGQFFLKTMKAKTIMDALIQYPAQFFVTLDDQNVLKTFFPRAARSSEAGRTAANDNQIISHHSPTSCLVSVSSS